MPFLKSWQHGGDRKSDQVGNIAHSDEVGRTLEIAASKAGPWQ
jgi:hypothetical protein